MTRTPTSPSTSELTRFTFFRGRVAMAALLKCVGVRPGDEVAIQAFTCLAVPEAVFAVGARPRYVDVLEDGFTMDPDALAAALSPHVRAVVVQHTFGLPADLDRIAAVCRRADVPFVEDCAHTLRSRWAGRSVGTFGAGAFYSFEASKPVFVGIGGSAIANATEVRQRMQQHCATLTQPSIVRQWQLDAMVLAHAVTYRPSTYWMVRRAFRATVALGLVKGNYNELRDPASAPAQDFGFAMGHRQRRRLRRRLDGLDRQTNHRRWVASQLRDRILPGVVQHVAIPGPAEPVFGRYPMLAVDRERLITAAVRARVELADFYATPVHPARGEALERLGYRAGSCPYAEQVARRVISLPTNRFMRGAALDRAVDLLGRATD